MRNYIKIIGLALVSLFGSYYVTLAQNDSLKFSGRIFNGGEKSKFKIGLRYNTFDGFAVGSSYYTVSELEANSKGELAFKIPNLNKPFKIDMYLCADCVQPQIVQYYSEPGDDINFKLFRNSNLVDSIVFTGSGSNKYNLIQSLNRLKEHYDKDAGKIGLTFHLVRDSTEFLDKAVKLSKLSNHYELQRLLLIKNSAASEVVKDLIKQEFDVYFSNWRYHMVSFNKENPTLRKIISKYYQQHIEAFFYPPNDLSYLCPKYLLGLSYKIQIDLEMSQHTEKVGLTEYYKSLKSFQAGKLRDRLFGLMALDWRVQMEIVNPDPPVVDSILMNIVELIETPYIKEELSTTLNRKVGSKLRFANFKSLDGKDFDSNSLRGKVFLIDVWFVGCTGCAVFHEKFEKDIYPLLKEHKDFSVLSVTLESNLDRWKNGIKSNKYASEDYINVTTGKWLDHPFMKYYNITGGPFLMLIDKDGNIFSSQSDNMALNPSSLIKLVNDAMLVNTSK